MSAHSRRFGRPAPLFDPLAGTVVREPRGSGSGWWVGAPGAYYDQASATFYLTYRLREPRPVRGGITRLAVSTDGLHFEDLWEVRKEQLDSPSIERCALLQGLDGRWRWYVSYVDPATEQWRIDVVTADTPTSFDLAARRKVFCAADLPGIEGVKDPYLFVVGRLTYLLASIGLSIDVPADQAATKHATGDIFNTGLTISSTGLAVSADGEQFEWLGVSDAPRGAWDAYCLRINSILHTPPGFTAFYDGSASVAENYEEKCGLAQSLDLRNWTRVSTTGPLIGVPYGSTSVRYVDCLTVGQTVWFYYELVRPDGSHELRACPVPAS
ncbi:MAG: hypothetical protein IT204_14325 [Fimbriimonadaceae bacterium]|nr:hypothetical protein [Fimbriimonadaceae bacterium]